MLPALARVSLSLSSSSSSIVRSGVSSFVAPRVAKMNRSSLVWSKIDEAPALATYALLPVVQRFARTADIAVEERDISLAGRIIAAFPDELSASQRQSDELAFLGELVKRPEANVVKLPNISASIPQLEGAIAELQSQGYKVPSYPREPSNDAERTLQQRYAKVLGSAVNPVLREGNSDRRAAAAVKKFAQKNPHRMMKPFPNDGSSKTRVATMAGGDFFASERSVTLDKPTTVRIEFVDAAGKATTMKSGLELQTGEVLDASFMSVSALREFYAKTIAEAKRDGVLLSLHLKATMMKVSDPIMFGHCVEVFFADVFAKYGDTLRAVGANVNNGFADVLEKISRIDDAAKRAEIEAAIEACYAKQPDLAMVDSRKGITNLHVPNDVIIDASMPVVVRDGGKMWNKADELQDCVAMVPDRCYSTMYQEMIEDCQKNGAYDPSTMGAVSNVGLMAQKAEEYGSHDKTFVAPSAGHFRVVDEATGAVVVQPAGECGAGDIFRACQTKDAPIQDWVRLAVERSNASGHPVIFWLDANRAHDAQLITKINAALAKLPNVDAAKVSIAAPSDAMRTSCATVRRGDSIISATGNVLRDYLTDLFPILELGTSARMLSIVPLLNGGGLFETGAGGSAPKHVEQFLKEGHLRWDSLGEYAALVPSLEMVGAKNKNAKATVLANALDEALTKYLENARAPSRKSKEIDNRGSTFYLAMYWARACANQTADAEIAAELKPVAEALEANEAKIAQELIDCQGASVDIGGYFHPNDAKANAAMRPSATFNKIIDGAN